MPLSDKERNRFEDDILFDRRITQSLYCGNCGYNLKTLPRSYVCPECGQQYNARRMPMKGIYFPHNVEPPFAQVAGTPVSATIAVALLIGAFNPLNRGRIIIGFIFAGIALCLAAQVYWRTQRLVKFRVLGRRLARQQDDE